MSHLVLITSDQRSGEYGTGFIVSRAEARAGEPATVRVVTAAHVVRTLGADGVRVQDVPAKVIADLHAVAGIDLAVLDVMAPIDGEPAILARGTPGLAIEVHGYENTASQLIGTALSGNLGHRIQDPAMSRNAPAWSLDLEARLAGGTSGSPVVEPSTGAVVGVVVRGSAEGKNDGVALDIDNLRAWAECPPIATLAPPAAAVPAGPGPRTQAPSSASSSSPAVPPGPYQFDVFICHASEDKAAFVEPLVVALQAQGVSVWFDRFEIRLGDDFRRKMDEGLGSSRFGVVVVSPRSDKYWTNTELSAFFNLEAMDGPTGEPRILPVRLDLTVAEITRRSPLLATRASLGSELGVDEIARRIAERVGDVRPTARPRSPLYNVPQRRAQNFVGREDDIAKVMALLRPGSKVGLAPAASIEGLAGIGKTELALHTAHRLAATDRFPRGIVWLDAEQPDLTAQWGGAVADALAVSPGPVDERAHSALRALSNAGPVLVVLDNVTSWTPPANPGPLPEGPNVAILLTSRARRLGGGSFDHVEVERLSRDASSDLLVRLAGRALVHAPGFEDLLTHLDGYAAALELAGAYLGAVPSSTPASYLARLKASKPRRLSAAQRHPFRGGSPPGWAVTWGEDRHGFFAAFAVGPPGGEVEHRMRWIPGGTFEMGSPEGEVGRFGDERQHTVTLTEAYWLGETPVTQALWVAVLGDNPSQFHGEGKRRDGLRPAESVSWDDCQRFIERLNQRLARPASGLPPHDPLQIRLPTEAEWERACRGETAGATWAGELSQAEVAPVLESIAWYADNAGAQTHPVGLKEANPYGLRDMLGNVWEWCQDRWGDYPDLHVTDPRGPELGAYRVRRGGAWSSHARRVRAACRLVHPPDIRNGYLGFRLAGGQSAPSK